MTGAYAGDVTPTEAWEILRGEPQAVLVDVRTAAEWTYVGIPDLRALGKETVLIPWQTFPTMLRNENFVRDVAALGLPPEAPIVLICRSGARSRAAAIALTAHGFSRCYNVGSGFEGDPDRNRRRGTVNGWKVDGLPWYQS